MDFAGAIDERKARPEFVMHAVWTIPHHIETATQLWSVGSEAGDNHIPTWPNRITRAVNIALPVSWLGEKMEDRTIMPDIKDGIREDSLRNIGLYPGYSAGAWAKAGASQLERRGRDVQHGNRVKAGGQEIVDEG